MSKIGVLKSLMKEVQAASKAAAAPEELARPLTAAERAAAGKAATEAIAKQPVTKMSEALGNVGAEGKKLRVTQADRTAAKYLGGPPFSGLQLVDPRYAEARATWGVKTPGAAKNIANQSDADVMWSTLIGSPFQHKSNEIVFDKLYKAFQKSAKEGNLSEELRAKFNAALEPHFGEGADILDPKLRKEIDTFDKRRIVGDLLMGEKLGGALRGGSIIPGGKIMMETAEPMLRDVETFSIGPRLFTLDKGVITRPDLHPAFPEILQGEDLGQLFTPVPNEIALPTFHEEFRRRTGRKKPGYYDLTMTPPGEPYPTQEITDKYLRHLQREGYAKGGKAKKGKELRDPLFDLPFDPTEEELEQYRKEVKDFENLKYWKNRGRNSADEAIRNEEEFTYSTPTQLPIELDENSMFRIPLTDIDQIEAQRRMRYYAEGGVAMADGGQTFPLQRPELVTEVSSRKPKHPLAELLGKGVGAVHEFASKPFGYENPPGEIASSLLGLPAVATTLERFAYGEPLTSGSGETLGLRPETTEALMTALPVAGEAARLGTKGAKALAPTARDVLEAGLEKALEPTRMYAVPPGKPGKVKAPANAVGFYNPAEKAALNLQRKQGPGSAFISDMKKLEQGVNDERIAELGLDQLAGRPNVTRDEVVALAEQNRIPLKETVRRPQREVDELDDFENTEISLEDSIKYYQGGIKQVQAELDRVLATAPDSPLVGQYQKKIQAMQRAIEDKQDQLMNARPAKFGPDMDESYSLPGGEDYREIRVRLPERKGELPNLEGFTVETVNENKYTGQRDILIRNPQGNIVTNRYGFRGDDAQALQDEAASRAKEASKEDNFYSSIHHDNEPNVLFHLRVANHVDEEGKKGLLIDELQSDWHQQGRKKGYGNKVNEQGHYVMGVPDAPFKDNWYQLGLKRAIKEAVDTGMDRVYLTTGARQNDRYSLKHRVDSLQYDPSTKTLDGWKDGQIIVSKTIPEEELPEFIGKNVASKLLKTELTGGRKQTKHELSGLDLDVGGAGMEQWYDKNYKNYLDRYAKQHGSKLGMTRLYGEVSKDSLAERIYGKGETYNNLPAESKQKVDEMLTNYMEPVYYIDLTDAMRESAKKGQSYKDGGSVQSDGVQDDLTDRFNQMLQAQYAEGGAVDLTDRFNKMLQAQYAEGGEVNSYNSDPDMSDGGLFVPAPSFANGGAVKSIWKVN